MARASLTYGYRRTAARAFSDLGFVLAVTFIAYAVLDENHLPLLSGAGTQLASVAAGLLVVNTASGLYQSGPGVTRMQALMRAAVALAVALPLTYLILSLLPDAVETPSTLTAAAMTGVASAILWRLYATRHPARAAARRRVLVYGATAAARTVGEPLESGHPDMELVGYYPGANETELAVPPERQLPATRTLLETARALGVDEIVVAVTERRAGSMPLRQLLDCKIHGVRVHDAATHFELSRGQIRIGVANAGWLIFGHGFEQGLARTMVKRVFDLTCSLLLLALAAPLMLLTAAAVRLESRGPVFYRQERVGLNGAPFEVVKFRSMRADAERDGCPRWATADDDRVTRVGRWIRRLRIDELPQLFNVLRGDMSLVGPRPERPYFVEQLAQRIPYFQIRHSIKPGVTGWAQVRYAYGSTVEDAQEKLQYDLYYVKNHSLLLDVLILLETVAVVLTGKGAR